MNRRAEKIKKIRGEIRSLKKQHAAAEPKVQSALEELRGILRTKLKTTQEQNGIEGGGRREPGRGQIS